MSRRIRLNPCDFLFWGQHRANARKGEGGMTAFMLLDLDGVIDSSTMLEALRGVINAHPVLAGGFRSTLLLGRPEWNVPDITPEFAGEAATRVYRFEDLRDRADPAAELTAKSLVGNVSGWELRNGPLFRLEHYALPNERARLILRWPHLLMDAEGAQWFLAELDRQLRGTTDVPAALAADGARIDPLEGEGVVARWRRFFRGTSYQSGQQKLKINVIPTPGQEPVEHRAIHRNWSAEETAAIQRHAKSVTPPGTGLYFRFLAACTLRAVHRLFVAHGVDTEAYLITMPRRVEGLHDGRDIFERRPMIGNYLVSPLICVARDRVKDFRLAGEDIITQLADYHRNRGDLMQWSMMWAASLLHAWTYQLIFLLPFGAGRFATGFSFYGEIDPHIRTMGPARVLNLWGGGPTTTPPGLNPVFSRFEDRLNFSLTYAWPRITDGMANDYVNIIEAEMVGP